jgi:hypothetical protein
MGAEKRDGRRQADHVLFLVVVELLPILGADQTGGDDRRAPVQAGVVADLFEGLQNLDVLEKALRDLLALGIIGEILEAENFALAGQRKLWIESGPIDLVAEFDARQHNAIRVQVVEETLKACFGELGIGRRERMAAPHGGEFLRLIGPRGRVGRVVRADDQLDANSLSGGAFGEIDALVVVRNAAADNSHLSRLELAEESILIGQAGAHGIDHVHAYDNLLR